MRVSVSRGLSRTVFAFSLCCALSSPAYAGAPPANDDIAAATVISAVPFTDSVATIADATGVPSDPNLLCKIGSVGPGSQTVWYRYTTGVNASYVTIDARNSDYDTVLGVFTGTPGALRLAAGGCNDDARAAPFGSALFGLRLEATTTYYLVLARNAQAAGLATLNLSVSDAPVYAVTRFDDPAPDTCAVSDCSLREAVSAANAVPGAVVLAAGTYTLSRSGANENLNSTGDLDIRAGMGIYGTGASGSGGSVIVQSFSSADRALHIDPQTSGRMSVAVSRLAISGFGASSFIGDGGGVLLDGASASFFASFASFDRVAVLNNRSSTVGGGLRLRARALVRDATVTGNTAPSGGGAYIGGDTLTLLAVEGSTFSTNSQTGNSGAGGAIYAGSPLWLSNSTLSGNRADASGGGIAVYAQASGLGFQLGHEKLFARGLPPDDVTVALQNGVAIRSSTIVRNVADFDGNNVGHGGGIVFAVAGEAALRNTILGDNLDLNASGNAPDCKASAVPSVISGYNTVEAPGDCGFFIATGDVIGSDAGVDVTLGNNGGLTQTHLLLPGSIALDSGDPAGCNDVVGQPLESDQREVPYVRSSGAGCDRGALEIQPQPAIPPSTPDMGTASDSGASSGDNITFIAQPTFLGSCSTGDTIEILVDGVAVTPSMTCTATIYSIVPDLPLLEGNHQVRARATLGMSTALSGILPITIDLTAPVSMITSGPSGVISATDATFVFSANEVVTFECRLDAGTFQPCTSPRNYGGLQLGAHSFTLRATDLAGNTESPPLTRTWTIRLAQTVTFPPINDRVIGDPPFVVTATSSVVGLVVNLTSLTPTVCDVTTPSPGTVTLLDVGTCTIRAQQPGDAVYAPAEVTRNFIVRPPAPSVPDLAQISDTGVSDADNITRAATLEFSGSCIDDDSIELLVDGSAVGSPFICVASSYTLSFAVPAGTHAIAARATRGTTSSSAGAALSVVVDRTAPAAPVITGPAASNSLTVTIVGNGENGATVAVSSGTPLCTSAPVASGTWNCAGTFAGLGPATVNATQDDVAGNTSAPSANFVVDVGALVFGDGFE